MIAFKSSGLLRAFERFGGQSAAIADEPPSRLRSTPEIVGVAVLVAAVSCAALWWFFAQGHLLYYGDALSHLNIARKIIDSRTPGFEQIGTVWLPLPHLLMLPLVGNDWLWRTGLAGAIPTAACFTAGGIFLFAAIRRAFASSAAALGAVLLVVSNPNMLYMQSIPMNEAILFAEIAAVCYFTVAFAQDQKLRQVAGAGAAILAATLTRYDGWFLIPFVCLFFLIRAKRNRILAAFLFGLIASLGPLSWLAHNWWYYGDPLEFYWGPYSHHGIYQAALAKGMERYRGDGDWAEAVKYVAATVGLCAGYPLAGLGIAGLVAAVRRKFYWLPLLLLLGPVFYVISMHGGGTPIFVPELWPFSYYNTRYGLSGLALLAVSAAALVAFVPARLRGLVLVASVAIAITPWIFLPARDSWICWKESQQNSEQRRAWTKEAADFLRTRYRNGGILMAPFGDLTGVFMEAGIHLRELLHSGNGPHYLASVYRPDLFLWEEWAVSSSDSPMVQTAIQRAQKSGLRYDCLRVIAVRGAPVIEIYRRAR